MSYSISLGAKVLSGWFNLFLLYLLLHHILVKAQ